MKLVRQAILARGTTDKVYEVDLCEVGPERWVVNFRHGSRGRPLVDGTKTVMPVSKSEAEKIYDRLVEEKLGSGYHHAGAPPPPAPRSQPAPAQPDDPRARAIIGRLMKKLDTSGWSLDRVIWRAGTMRLRAAEPHLLELLRTSKEPMRTYALCWALARCGSVHAIADLERVRQTAKAEHEKRIALEALRAIVPAEHRAGAPFWEETKKRIPRGLLDLAESGPPEAFAEELQARIDARDRETIEALHPLYAIENQNVRPGLSLVLQTAPLEEPHFRALRAIFKAAEVRSDAEVFGILAHRIEKTPGAAVPYYYYGATRELRAFTKPTKKYLRRRVWRTLRKLAELESEEYVRMALGVLLPFSDADAHEVRRSPGKTWDRYAPYWALNQIIYGRSPRYRPAGNAKTFVCKDYRPGDPAPAAREERFPELWDRAPEALLHLLDGSRCDVIHEFAVRALRAQREFLDRLDVDAIVMLLTRPYAVTAQLGFELAEKRWDPARPDLALIRAVILCRSEPARRKAQRWIESDRYRFLEETELMAVVAGSEHADNRSFARDLLRSGIVSDEKAKIIVARLIAILKSLAEAETERARDIGETLQRCFSRQIVSLGLEVVRDLLRHPLEAVQVIAGDILLAHEIFSRDVPEDLLIAMLDSKHASVRSLGARLLAQLTDDLLRARAHLVLHLTAHELPELRAGIRPALSRLALDPIFAAELVRAMIQMLGRKAPEGVHAHLFSILTRELAMHLDRISGPEIWKLLNARTTEAQELGGRLMLEKLRPEDLTVAQLVKLFSHEVLAVRRAAWSFADRSLPRLQQAMATSVRLLDAKWEDSRHFAFALFRTRMEKEQLTPRILVAICDSIRPDVQQFGRELITRYFEDADGHEYLLRLSEHPSQGLQLFATNYFERYASGNLERLSGLRPYFLAVLSRVNKGRVTKLRCYDFLQKEALESREAAEIVAGIMARQSATISIEYRAKAIETMLAIRRRHPDLELPLETVPEEVRGAV